MGWQWSAADEVEHTGIQAVESIHAAVKLPTHEHESGLAEQHSLPGSKVV